MRDKSSPRSSVPGQAPRRPRTQKIRKVTIGKREVLTSGLAPSFWNDVYFAAMTASWPAFLGGLGLAFVLINAAFALLYSLGRGSIANTGDDLERLFYFSVETLTTVGYGEFFPQTRFGHIAVSLETFTGLFFSASMLGLIFARLSRPRARLMFARSLTVGPYEGRRTLFARVANARLNMISSANARLWMVSVETSAEGVEFRRFAELKLLRAENPTFVLSWTILHVIDEDSALHRLTPDDLVRKDAFFILAIAGHDETSAQVVQARETYLAADLCWEHRYVDVLATRSDGTSVLRYEVFHDVEPVPFPDRTGEARGEA